MPGKLKEAYTLNSSKGSLPFPLIIAATVSTLGGFLFGYDNIVISGAIGYLSRLFQLDAASVGWAAGCGLIGCVVGCAAAGAVADSRGKKKGLALCALCCAVSSAGLFFARDLHQFVLWRLFSGVGIGAASVIAPNYIAEIAPTRTRGRYVTLYQLGIVVGILSAVLVNMVIQCLGDETWNVSVGWRWMFLAGAVPAILFGVMILPAVEQQRAGVCGEELRNASFFGGQRAFDFSRLPCRVFRPIDLYQHADGFFPAASLHQPARAFGTMLAGLQQISGITPLFSFLPEIFRIAFGNGVACWVIISEIYPTKVRGRGMSIATTTLWLVGYAGNQLFLSMQQHLGADGTFWVFSGGALLTVALVGWLVPETKGRSLEEISQFWLKQKFAGAA